MVLSVMWVSLQGPADGIPSQRLQEKICLFAFLTSGNHLPWLVGPFLQPHSQQGLAFCCWTPC